jgi:hypothetical protein
LPAAELAFGIWDFFKNFNRRTSLPFARYLLCKSLASQANLCAEIASWQKFKQMMTLFENKDVTGGAASSDVHVVRMCCSQLNVLSMPVLYSNVSLLVWQMLETVPVDDYRAREHIIWSAGPKVKIPVHKSRSMHTLKLVLGGCEFYDTVCGVKNIEYRTSAGVITALLTKPVHSVILYHGYFKSESRPYVHKVLEGCVMLTNGVRVKYPRVEVESDVLTIAIKLGQTLEYFNPHTKDPFSWHPKSPAVRRLSKRNAPGASRKQRSVHEVTKCAFDPLKKIPTFPKRFEGNTGTLSLQA